MMRSTVIRSLVLAVAVLAGIAVGQASAETCGDADGSGGVTVTDGVQVLRFVAGLSSSCTEARCDVDGSGGITVTDGVNVLRTVAGLSAPSACPGGGGGDGVQESIDAVVPFFAFGFAFASDVSLGSAAVAPAGDVEDPCPDGGVRTKRFLSANVLRIGFTACRYSNPVLGRFEFGQGLAISFPRAQVSLSVLVTDLDSGRVVLFEGFFDFVPRDGGGFVGTGQDIVITTPQGNFTLDLNALTVDGDGNVLSGGGAIEDSDNNFALARIDFQVSGPGVGQLTASFDDGSTKSFSLNLITGQLTEN